jgi:hypothetical protein
VLPSPYWGQPGSLIKVPRAVIYPVYNTANSFNQFNNVLAAAIGGMASELEAAGIFAGPAAAVGHMRGSAVPQGLPWTAVNEIEEDLDNSGFITVFGRTFSPDDCMAGETLYIHLADSDSSAFPLYFFDDINHWQDFEIQKADDRAYIAANQPRHARVRWLCVSGVDNVISRGGVFDGDRQAQSIAELNSDWASLGFVGRTIAGQPRFSAPARALMVAEVEAQIRDFFDL